MIFVYMISNILHIINMFSHSEESGMVMPLLSHIMGEEVEEVNSK